MLISSPLRAEEISIPTNPSELANWFSSGAATLMLLIFAVKYFFERHQKLSAKEEFESDKLEKEVVKLRDATAQLTLQHSSCRINEYAQDFKKFSEKLGEIALKWGIDKAHIESDLKHISESLGELKARTEQLKVDDIRERLTILESKVAAAFEIIDGKRGPR